MYINNNIAYSNYKPEMALVVHGHWKQQYRTEKSIMDQMIMIDV